MMAGRKNLERLFCFRTEELLLRSISRETNRLLFSAEAEGRAVEIEGYPRTLLFFVNKVNLSRILLLGSLMRQR